MRSEGYSTWVCLSVCPCSNSLLDGLFVPQTIRRNKRVIRISLIERFSLKMLCCRDLSVTSIVRVHSAGHFLLAENEHAHYIITTTWPSGRERLSCLPRVTIFPGYHASKQGLPTMSRLKLKLCKCCQHVFQSKRKAEYSLSDQATKRTRVSKATKRASETSEQTLHRQLFSGTTHAQFAEGLHFSAFHYIFIIVVYRKYYIEVILSELSNTGQPSTYCAVTDSHEHLIRKHVIDMRLWNIRVPSDMEQLPSMYWLPKLHKY